MLEHYLLYYFHNFLRYLDKLSLKYPILAQDLTITELEQIINQIT